MIERESPEEFQNSEQKWGPNLLKRPREESFTDEDASDNGDNINSSDDSDSDSSSDSDSDSSSDSDSCTAPDAKRLKVQQNLRCEDYTVGWVCALPKEMTAARLMLDGLHQSLAKIPDDENNYTFGSIGGHNIVIACLPSGQYGTTSAAIVAENMRRSFPSIKIRLMVGIGGGAPDKYDVRLGDVVVSHPTATSSGVVPYNFGKTVQAGRFEQTGFLNKPPRELLAVVSKLRSEDISVPSRISVTLTRLQERDSSSAAFTKPPDDPDRLFDAAYDHIQGEDTCIKCEVSKLLDRPRRPNDHPNIHYGVIASADQVMKHGLTRRQLSDDHNPLCFEMEAAGLMDTFPCLVIRGICDYSDSHKAKKWQEYAAATAASYAREILCAIPTHETQKPLAHANLSPADKTARRKEIWESLKFDQIDNRQTNIKSALGKTCRWLTSHQRYKDWLDPMKLQEHHGFLWISGKPGAGKSTIMKFVMGRVKKGRVKNYAANSAVIHFFFNARGDEIEKTTVGLYRSLLHQLLQLLPDLQEVLDTADFNLLAEDRSFPWELRLLQKIFKRAIRKLGQRQITCFIDALDECAEDEVREMVKFFEELGRTAVKKGIKLYTCFSSRHYPHISIRNGLRLILEDQTGHEKDLEEYVRNKLETETAKQTDDLTAKILRKASGVFMWVVLVIDILNKEIRRGRMFAVKGRLDALPAELSDLFEDILTRDNENMEDLLLSIQWILFGKRSLKREEYYFALLSGLNMPYALAEWSPEEVSTESMELFVVSSSKGLAETITTKSKDRMVQFIHESVRDFLLKDNGLRRLWPELGDNFEDRSHDRLKDCCFEYFTKVDISAHMSNDQFALKISTDEARRIKTNVTEGFPFFDYATSLVLYHADAAAHTIPQDEFFLGFPVDRWIKMNNVLQDRKIRRHKPTSTSLMYISAEKGLSMLVETALRQNVNAEIQGGRYKYPLLAAMKEGHERTAEVLLRCIAEEKGQSGNNSHHVPKSDGSTYIAPSINCQDEEGRTPLYFAAQQGYTDIATTLFKLGATIDSSTNKNRHNVLLRAVEKKQEAIVKLILHERSKTKRSRTAPVSASPKNWNHGEGQSPDVGIQHEITTETGYSASALNGRSEDKDSSEALFVAGKTGHAGIARLLLEYGANINGIDYSGCSPLEHAIQNKDEAAVLMLLDMGADASRSGQQNRTPLHRACIANQSAIVKALINRGSDIEAIEEEFMTPLHYACQQGSSATAELLIKAGARVDTVDNRGNTPLSYACQQGSSETAELLIKAGARVDTVNDMGNTPLSYSCKQGSSETAELLIKAGARVDTVDSMGNTPLSYACQQGSSETAELLIKAGANLLISDEAGKTPIFYAAVAGDENCLDTLLRHGADINERNGSGQTPLFAAAQYGSMRGLSHLLERNPDLSVVNDSGQTAMFVTGYNGIGGQRARLLVKAGMDPKHRDNSGRTMLHVACLECFIDLTYLNFIEEEIKNGFPLDSHDNTGRTPLLNAAGSPNFNCVEILLRNGADPNATDDEHRTPLFEAISSKNPISAFNPLRVVRLLLRSGADATKAGPNGETPIDLAVRLGSTDILELLQSHLKSS